MKTLLITALLAFSVAAHARLPVPVSDADQWRVQGSGEMRWFGFSIYGAKLWRSGERWQQDAPYALELTYRRTISAEQLVNTSIDEMERLGEKDEKRLQQWRVALEKVFPSVREGDVIVGLHEPGKGARFFFNGAPTGSLNDARLAAAFFAIWLDPRTKAPELRTRLLAEAESARP